MKSALIDTYEDATDFLERLDVVEPKAERARDQGNQVQIVVGKIAGYDDDPEEMAITREYVESLESSSPHPDPDNSGENE